ncbi:MAG: VaFE repeat-containing surface-anchored protein, partial [Erysipelotrichaceae bacterium]|nr:VaFE repeat-containing surface-anchored protein [Erysipelotrichaceae bacterium]
LDDLDNHELVVFETLYRIVTHDDGTTEEIKVVEHKDLDDEGQTVYVDELYRRDFEIIKVNADDEEEVLQGVTFNIKTYRIKRDGVVEDYNLGNYTTDENGMISIEKLKEDCKITVTEIAEKDPTWYRWEEAFIYDIGHDDSIIEVLSESILNHKIKIGTTAIFEESEDKNYVADGVAHIIDTVSYEWLYEGDEYKLVATLIDKGTEEEPLEEEAMTVEHEFVAEGLSGSEDVSIEFDFTDKENHDFVVFEELYHIVENEEGEKEEVKVAEHKDIDDEDQTVHCDELYRALMVMYKTNETKTIRLNGAIFTVTTKRTRRDGSIVTGNLGRFVTGGIYYEQATAFTYKIATDEEMSDVVRTITSSAHSKFGTQYIQITDLEPGVYYGQVSNEETIRKYVVARGMIYLEDQVEDTLITYHEEIAPEGYYLPGDDFVADVGHDDTVTRIENERPNTRIIHRGGDTPVVPKTGFDGE